jgi:hypothetical protein
MKKYLSLEDWCIDLERIREYPNDKHLLESIIKKVRNSDNRLLEEIKKHLQNELKKDPESSIFSLDYYRSLKTQE